jgi:hypothetical protein
MKMFCKRNSFWFIFLLVLSMAFTACAKKEVRYLASDVSLITPDKTTKQGVLNILGQPNEQYAQPTGEEVWVYYEVKKDMLSGTPVVGDKLGKEIYEVVKVTFTKDTVRSSVYRAMSEEEFNQYGLTE